MKDSSFLFLFAACFLSFLCGKTHAKLITSDWHALKSYEKIISCFSNEKPFYGQRSWTEQSIADHLKRLSAAPSPLCPAEQVDDLFRKVRNALPRATDQSTSNLIFLPIRNVAIDYAYLHTGFSSFVQNTVGGIDANIDTFREYKRGDLWGAGHDFKIVTEHELRWNPLHLTFFLRPQADLLMTKTFGYENVRLNLSEANLVYESPSLTFIAGRSPLVWGQSEYGGFLFSENARALDHIQATNSRPFRLPWIFKVLGRWKTSFVFGTLGPKQRYPWTLFTGLSLGLKPTQNSEINLSHAFEFGGEGANSISFFQGIREFFGFIPSLSQTSRLGVNKISSLHGRYHFDKFMGLQTYAEYAMDDSNVTGGLRALKKHFTYNSSYKIGLYFIRPFESLSDDLRIELAKTAPLAYRHGEFSSGWTINENILGDPLGPDGTSVTLSWGHTWTDQYSTVLRHHLKRRDSDSYALSADGYSAFVTQDGLSESRTGIDLTNQIALSNTLLKVGIGYEWVKNRGFITQNQSHYYINMGVNIPFSN